MASNEEYWTKRFEELEKAQIYNESRYVQELQEQYERTLMEIENQINSWLARFAVNNQISISEAKKWLNTRELKELKWKVEEYIKYGQENGIDLIWKKELENASARVHIARLEALEMQIQNELEKLYYNEEQTTREFIIESYRDTYYKTAYELQKGSNVAFKFAVLDLNTINKIISKPWTTDAQTFSDRIWKNKRALIDTLQKDLEKAVVGDADKLIDKIAKDFNVSKNKAGTLVMTESAFFTSTSRKDCFNNLGVEKFINIATLDSRTSEICRTIDGTVYDMKDFKIGVTAPPFHVRCRTTYGPYFEDEYEFGERAARNVGGKTYYVPSNLKYNEWLEKYVYSDPEAKKAFELDIKMRKNQSSDYKQYNNYKNTLGNDVPKTFAQFQDMKYNNKEEYNYMKNYYRLFNSGGMPKDLTYSIYKNNLSNNNWQAVGFNPQKLSNHFNKHGSEFNLHTAEEYEKFAKNFMNNEIKDNIEGFVNDNGYVFKYDNKNNIFGTAKPTGITETIFKPKNGKDYWKEQINRYGKQN